MVLALEQLNLEKVTFFNLSMYVSRSFKYLLKSPNYPQRSSKTSFDFFQGSKLNIFPLLCFVTRRKIEEFQESFALFPHVNSSLSGFPFSSVSLDFSCIFQILALWVWNTNMTSFHRLKTKNKIKNEGYTDEKKPM